MFYFLYLEIKGSGNLIFLFHTLKGAKYLYLSIIFRVTLGATKNLIPNIQSYTNS